jgi:hypothetical protein
MRRLCEKMDREGAVGIVIAGPAEAELYFKFGFTQLLFHFPVEFGYLTCMTRKPASTLAARQPSRRDFVLGRRPPRHLSHVEAATRRLQAIQDNNEDRAWKFALTLVDELAAAPETVRCVGGFVKVAGKCGIRVALDRLGAGAAEPVAVGEGQTAEYNGGEGGEVESDKVKGKGKARAAGVGPSRWVDESDGSDSRA